MRNPIISAVLSGVAVITFGFGARAVTGTIVRLSDGSPSDQQNSPAISGTNVVWTEAFTPSGGASNFDIFSYDLTTGLSLNLTNSPSDLEFLEDIDGTSVVYTRTAPGVPGDIVVYDLSTSTLTTIAGSSSTVFYQQPAIRGQFVTYLRGSSQIDVAGYDNNLGPIGLITSDPAVQSRPRVGGGYVVYEDYTNGNSDIRGWRIPSGPSFAIASGPNDQITPDIDGNTVVWVQNIAGHDQLFAFDLVSGVTSQLTTSASTKVLPRISGSRIVWADDRSGNLDMYAYDLSMHAEGPIVAGPGDQFLADIDGDRMVYTSNERGFEEVYLFTFDANSAPLANAGPDQTVQYTATLPTIQLDGCSSTDDGRPSPPGALTFHWEQVGGGSLVALSDPGVCNPTFVAPRLGSVSSDVLTFQLTVSDGQLQGQAAVNITTVNANHPPECHASAPPAVAEGTPSIALDGSSSFDPDGDHITAQWVQIGGPIPLLLTSPNEPVAYFNAPILASGNVMFTFELAVDDGELMSTCTVAVTVDNVDHCPVADAGNARTVSEGSSVMLDGGASNDIDGDTLLYSWTQIAGPSVVLANPQAVAPSFQAPPVGPSGADLVFQLSVDDQLGCARTAIVTVHVADVADGPTCETAAVSPALIWPPNNKLVPVYITGVGTSGLATTIQIDGVVQDEPVGERDRDAVIHGATALIRAERSGGGDGRVYHMRFTATNAQGACIGDVSVCVPYSNNHSSCVDEGGRYDSTLP